MSTVSCACFRSQPLLLVPLVGHGAENRAASLPLQFPNALLMRNLPAHAQVPYQIAHFVFERFVVSARLNGHDVAYVSPVLGK